MKKEFMIAGVLVIIVGVLFFAFSQISRTREVETLQVAFSKDVSQSGINGVYPTVEAPLESYTNYKFNVTSKGVFSSPDINVTNPDGYRVPYTFDSWATDIGVTNCWGYSPTYGCFRSGEAGNYVFSITGFVGDPNISLNVFEVGSREQAYYPYESFIFVAIGLWAVGIVLAFVGIFWAKKS